MSVTSSSAQQLWFAPREYQSRLARVQEQMRLSGLDGLVLHEPESITYLTGFFSHGYRTSFQVAVVPQEGEPTTLLREVELYHFRQTAFFHEHVVWSDGDDIDASTFDLVRSALPRARTIGLELDSWRLTARRYSALRRLDETNFVDASRLVASLRFRKSPAELDYMRRAAVVAERTMAVALETTRADASERELGAAVAAAMIRAGSDRGEPGPLASGERAYHIHGGFTDRVMRLGDLVHVEVTPHVRNYHARFMRPIAVGAAKADDLALARALTAVQDRALAEVGPGVAAAVPDRVYREGIARAGTIDYRNKTFYSIGLLLLPNSAEQLEATADSTWTFETGMTFHTYLVVRGLCFSESIVVTEHGCERLTRFRRELLESST